VAVIPLDDLVPLFSTIVVLQEKGTARIVILIADSITVGCAQGAGSFSFVGFRPHPSLLGDV
jgi:hypothetical protein